VLCSQITQAADKNSSTHAKSSIHVKSATSNSKKSNPKKQKIDPTIVKQTEEIKSKVIKLNRELYRFEEDLLYPTNTQLAVFLSISPQSHFKLDSIELLLDEKLVASYLYKENEIFALKKGGIQRLYLGSLSDGKHKLTAQFNGQKASSNYFRLKKAFNFTKEHDAKFIQMVISESTTTHDPLFKVKLW